ncbi:hypothetical protein IT571_03465 [Candidatus Sumerlaeota bacterium]|nr:hypothetical protein [Candidatus Sumerlaeota bacterium]
MAKDRAKTTVPLLSWLLLYGAALAVGRLLCWRILQQSLRESFNRAQVLIIEVMLGVGVLGTLALVGSAAGILRQAVAASIIVALGVCGFLLMAGELRALLRSGIRWLNMKNIGGALLLLLIFAPQFRLAWHPNLQLDAWVYHFTVPKQWLMHGRLIEVPYEASANYYLLAQAWMLWGIALCTDDTILPHLHSVFACAGMTIFLLLEMRRHIGGGAAWLLAAMWLACDEMFEFSHQDYIDVQQGFFVLVGCVVAVRALDSDAPMRRNLMIVSGLLVGFAAAMKIMALGVFVTIVIVSVAMNWKARAFRDTLWFTGAFFAVLMPWIIKSIVFTGNPVYPFAVDLFPTFTRHIRSAKELHGVYSDYLAPAGFGDVVVYRAKQLLTSLRLATYIDQLMIAWLFVVAFLMAILRRDRSREATAALWIGVLLLPFTLFTPAQRFAIGAQAFQFLILAICVGRVWDESVTQRRRWTMAAIVGALLLVAWRESVGAISTYNSFLSRQQPRTVSLFPGTQSMIAEWHATHDYYTMVQYIEQHTGGNDIVMTIGSNMVVPLLDVPIFENSHVNGADIFTMLADEGNDADAIAEKLKEWKVTRVLAISGMPTDGEGAAFVNKYLEPEYSAANMTFYRVRRD